MSRARCFITTDARVRPRQIRRVRGDHHRVLVLAGGAVHTGAVRRRGVLACGAVYADTGCRRARGRRVLARPAVRAGV